MRKISRKVAPTSNLLRGSNLTGGKPSPMPRGHRTGTTTAMTTMVRSNTHRTSELASAMKSANKATTGNLRDLVEDQTND